jgi:Flagellar hook-length control protein FliK
MTLISVGSTGTTATPKGARGSSPNDGAAPSGFEELLAGAHPAHEPGREPLREMSHESHDERPCDGSTADAATADDAGAAEATDGIDDSTGDHTAPKTDTSDPAGFIAALAVPVPTTPTTTVAPTDGDATSGGTPGTDATSTVVDPSVLVDATDVPPPPPVIDLAEVIANLPADDPSPTVEPVLLPLPDLPTATPPRAVEDAGAASTATTREASTSAFTAAHPTEHARPAPGAPPPTGAATFAVAAPPPAASSAMAAVNAEDATGAARVAPPPPSEQLVSVLTPLRTNQNGSYTLRLELKPPELGRIEMRVEMRDGVLHASIHAEHHNSAQVLRDALSDLRERLSSEGVRAGDLTVSDGSVESRQHESGKAPESRATPSQLAANDEADLTATDASAGAAIPESEGTSTLDVRV